LPASDRPAARAIVGRGGASRDDAVVDRGGIAGDDRGRAKTRQFNRGKTASMPSSRARTPEEEMGVEMRREEVKALGLVWVDCPDSVVSLGLKAALEGRARVCRGTRAPVGLAPSLVVSPAAAEGDVAAGMERARAAAPGAPVVVVGLGAALPIAREALRLGARGFVHAGMRPGQIARALSLARGGELVVPRELLAGLVAREEEGPPRPALTPRQGEILGLLVEGLTNAQIAGRLHLSEFTVKQHLRAAYKAFGVGSRTQAARAWRGGGVAGVVGGGVATVP
jgi:DNA-binding NarL/FixJ family response regulator